MPTSLEQSIFGSNLGANLSSMLNSPAAKNTVIVPVPVQAPTTKKSSSVSTKTSMRGGASTVQPTPLAPIWGPSVVTPQDPVPAMPTQPVWQQDLSGFLNGTTLPQAMTPPTYQGFGTPVFSDMQAFTMSPEEYTKVLDTTKNNIAFNNKVAGDNYNNTLNIIKTLQASDQAQQEQFSRNLQNRGQVLQGNRMQQDLAFNQSPQQKADMEYQLRGSLQNESDTRHANLAKEMAGIQHRYEMIRSEAHDNRVKKDGIAAGKQELQSLLLKTDIDIWKSATKGFTEEELNLITKAGTSSNALEQLMANSPNVTPLSRFNMRAAFESQQRIKAAGGNVGSIFSAPGEKKQEEGTSKKAFNSKADFLKYKGD